MRLTTFAVLLGLALAAPAAAAEKLTLMLDWFVNPDHAPIIVADELGYFANAGLDVEIVAPADPNDPPKLVAAGQADVAISYQPQLHIQVDQGLPLTRIGTLVATPLNSLVVLADGPIEEIADLKGRKVGFSVGGFEDALLGAMLGHHGLKLDDVELVNVNFALSPALLSGQVDAVIGAFRNFELNQLELEGRPGRAFYPEEQGVPDLRRADLHREHGRACRPAPAALHRRHRGRHPVHPEPSGGELRAVHRGPPGAGRRAEPARLRRHAAALCAAPRRARPRPLRPFRRLPRTPGPDRPAAARSTTYARELPR